MDVNDGHLPGPPGQGLHSVADTGDGAESGVAVQLGAAEDSPIHPRLLAMIVAGRYHGMELDPKYVDVVVMRWQTLTGKAATLEGDPKKRTFQQVASERLGKAA